jgi:hypothetical protein
LSKNSTRHAPRAAATTPSPYRRRREKSAIFVPEWIVEEGRAAGLHDVQGGAAETVRA